MFKKPMRALDRTHSQAPLLPVCRYTAVNRGSVCNDVSVSLAV